MKTVNILELDDVIDPEDWCRPLQVVSMSGGYSDHYSFQSQYTGAPENNVKWVKVKYILGKGWHGQTVRQYNICMRQFGTYEFVRGDIPDSHKLNLNDYRVTDYTKVYRHTEEDDDLL
jgi:hypothetical protein